MHNAMLAMYCPSIRVSVYLSQAVIMKKAEYYAMNAT